MYTGRAAIGYDHGQRRIFDCDNDHDPAYVEGFVEGCIEATGADDPGRAAFIRTLWIAQEVGEVLEAMRDQCNLIKPRHFEG